MLTGKPMTRRFRTSPGVDKVKPKALFVDQSIQQKTYVSLTFFNLLSISSLLSSPLSSSLSSSLFSYLSSSLSSSLLNDMHDLMFTHLHLNIPALNLSLLDAYILSRNSFVCLCFEKETKLVVDRDKPRNL